MATADTLNIPTTPAGKRRIPDDMVRGLALLVQGGSQAYTFRYTDAGGKRVEIGIGSAATLTVIEARAKAAGYAAMLKAGQDPRGAKERDAIAARERIAKEANERAKAAARQVTFAQAVFKHLEGEDAARKAGKGWKSDQHRGQWEASLAKHVLPKIGHMLVADITKHDLKPIFEPLFLTMAPTASRICRRVEAIFTGLKANDVYGGDNPADLIIKIIRAMIGKNKTAKPRVEIFASLHYDEMDALLPRLRP
jgi:hypothetical protein